MTRILKNGRVCVCVSVCVYEIVLNLIIHDFV
jgi:hypothetical protein